MTDDAYLRRHLTGEKLARFMASGEGHVERVWRAIQRAGIFPYRPDSALDFGCAVGRVALALAGRCGSVLGVDVSPSMLRVAERLRAERGIENLSYALVDDSLRALGGPFDFIHSYIVLQHIPVRRGLKILRALFGALRPGGVCAIQLVVTSPHPLLHAPLLRPLRVASQNLRRLLGQRPRMQMNAYPANEVFALAHAAGLVAGAIEFSDHKNHLSVFLTLVSSIESPELTPDALAAGRA
ncbi:MAG: class I SAM-dependent methyltransferase [Myxococcota bacterium]